MAFVNPRQKHRNTTLGLSTKYGQAGEICVDTDKNTVVIMDGMTQGGFPVAREDSSNTECEDDSYLPLDIETIVSDFSLPATNDNIGLRAWIKKFGSILQAYLSEYANGICTTAGATADKVVSLTGYSLVVGSRFKVSFTNKNTVADALTMNVNSTGAKTIYHADGTAISATNPAYFVANCPIEFWYDGTGYRFKQEVVKNYVNGTTWYNLRNDGWVKHAYRVFGQTPTTTTYTLTFVIPMLDSNYSALIKGHQIVTSNNPLTESYGQAYWGGIGGLTSTTIQYRCGTSGAGIIIEGFAA